MIVSKPKTSDVIAVNKEAYLYLNRIGRAQRGCKPLDQDHEESLWKRMRLNNKGLKELDNESLGGGDGTYNGRWWSWDVPTLRQMLIEGGFTWEECGQCEYIDVSI